jgi:CRP-like cAMP-binding protein
MLRQFFHAISPLTDETWLAIESLFIPRELKAAEFFVEERAIATEIAFLQSGCVRAFFTNANGKEYNKQFFVGPSLIGAYTSLLTGEPNLIPQQALTECKILVTNHNALEQLFSQFHDLERLARKIAEHYFLEKERKELEMALDDATARYLRFRKQFPTLEQLIPQYHIASYLSISATQLRRIRHKLSQQAS